ncbi:ZFY16 protein, partial [Rhinopomastus cyanomelas]|nr:ZFY16 protein [Rhinopomastus cyanomelas]
VKSMPSDLPKRELRKCSAALSEDSIFPESMCQTEAKVELEKKITEESVDDEELDSNKILNTASTACISAEDVQTSLSDLPVSVLVVTEEKVNPLPQNEVVEVVSDTLMESHAGKSNADPCGRESCEKTDLNEQDGYGAKIGASIVEKSADGDNYNNENATDDIDPQEALPSVFLEYEAEPYAVDIDSYYSDSMSPDTADFNIKENIITSSVAISDAELDDFLYGESLQSNVLKSSDNDSNLIEADTDEGHLTNVNNLEFTEVTEEHMQANLEEIMSISSDCKQSPTTSESESATEDTTCCTQGMTESGSGAVVPNVCREGARPKQLLGLSQVAAGQRKQNKPSVLEIENQEATCGTTEATASDNNVDVAKNSAPACSVESSSKAEGNQTSENAESFKKTAALSWKQPLWVPDSEAPNCMNCQVKFTFTRRRHHCRACGKVFCGGCCKRKCKLQYMEKEARVCTGCYNDINKGKKGLFF